MEKKQINVALCGAGGKMGMRVMRNLRKHDTYHVFALETFEKAIERVRSVGMEVSGQEVLPQCQLVILAVPDVALEKVSDEIVPQLTPGSIVIILDPAAAYMKRVCLREDCTFVVVHPCHPALFVDYKSGENGKDFFGGDATEQDIVLAKICGDDDHVALAHEIAVEMFAPVITCHHITVEQMALLEPAAAEVVIATCACVMKEAIDEAIAHGVPEAAARAFLMGHIQIPLAILFQQSNPFSDAAQIAINYGREKVFKENWRDVFSPEAVHEVLQKMLHLC